MSVCPRCTGKDGAHYMECVVGRLFERLMGDDYPWRAPIAHATGALVPPEVEAEHRSRKAEIQARDREEIFERLMETTGVGGSMEAADEAVGEAQTEAVQEAVAVPPPNPLLMATLDDNPAVPLNEPDVRPTGTGTTSGTWGLDPDAQAALDLFISEKLEKAGPRTFVAAGDLMKAYEEWRPTVDGPAIAGNRFGRGLTRAGLTHKRQANMSQAKNLFDGNRPVLYYGWKFKGAEVEDHPPVGEQKGKQKDWSVAAAESVKRFMGDCLILGENGYNGVPWVERRDWVPGYALAAAHRRWRDTLHPDEPVLSQRDVSMGLRANGYAGRQVHTIGDTKPTLYYGVVLRPELNWGKPRVTETVEHADEPKEDHSAEVIRSLMKAAKKAARPPKPAPADPPAPKPNLLVALQMEQTKQREEDNNGWFKAPAASNGTAAESTLTIEDIEAENAAIVRKERSQYTGKRPGSEIPKEYREMIAPLLELPGWRYEPHNPRGKGKPRIYNPEGKLFCLPNTPSDVKGLMASKTMLRNSLGAPL